MASAESKPKSNFSYNSYLVERNGDKGTFCKSLVRVNWMTTEFLKGMVFYNAITFACLGLSDAKFYPNLGFVCSTIAAFLQILLILLIPPSEDPATKT